MMMSSRNRGCRAGVQSPTRGTGSGSNALETQPHRSHMGVHPEVVVRLSAWRRVCVRCCRSAHADVSELTLRRSRRGFGTQLGAPRCIRSACAAPFAGHGHRHGVHVVSSSSVCSHQRPVLAVANSCPPSSCWRKRPSASQLCWPAYGVSLELGASP